MTEAPADELPCSICGKPCAGRPHAIDARGAAICRDCLDRERETLSIRRPQERELVQGLLQEKMEGAWQCPNCNHFVPEHSLICLGCGFNRKRRKKHVTRVRAPKHKRGHGG